LPRKYLIASRPMRMTATLNSTALRACSGVFFLAKNTDKPSCPRSCRCAWPRPLFYPHPPLSYTTQPAPPLSLTLSIDASPSGELQRAIKKGNLDAAKKAIEEGADLNLASPVLPIILAVWHNNSPIVDYLARLREPHDEDGKLGKVLIDRDARDTTKLMNGGTCCHAASGQNNAVMLLLLSNYGFSECEQDNEGQTPNVSNLASPSRTEPAAPSYPKPPSSSSIRSLARSLYRWSLGNMQLARGRGKGRLTTTR